MLDYGETHAQRWAYLLVSMSKTVSGISRRINKFRIIDFGLADFSEYYPQGRVDVGGPTHAVPKKGPLHISLGKVNMSLPLPMSMQQMKALPKVSCRLPPQQAMDRKATAVDDPQSP